MNFRRHFNIVKQYRSKLVLIIGFGWMLADQILWLGRPTAPEIRTEQVFYEVVPSLLRAVVVLAMSLFIGYLLVFRFRHWFRSYKRINNILLKTLILIASSFIMNFISQVIYLMVIEERNLGSALRRYIELPSEKYWLAHGVPLWLLIFGITQLLIEVNEKYSPGVFADIVMGKYSKPIIENRIVMFLDLKDSTPLAERLGHKRYFSLIHDFIDAVSEPLLQNSAHIYQYVGDEIVVSWHNTPANAAKCLAALISARGALQEKSRYFRSHYDAQPDFRVGIHAGEVTIGEIGIIKKDLAMSGDTMNTTARIRTACSELGQKYIVSLEFLKTAGLDDFQVEYLGRVDLKGKRDALKLYALKI